MKTEILAAVDDLVGAFLYYDRKEDEDLPRGEIEKGIVAGDVTVAEIVARFAEGLAGASLLGISANVAGDFSGLKNVAVMVQVREILEDEELGDVISEREAHTFMLKEI